MYPYQEQLKRVERWLSRIRHSSKHDRNQYEDFLWAFFQNCWHLKDWIMNDTNSSALGKFVKEEAENQSVNKEHEKHQPQAAPVLGVFLHGEKWEALIKNDHSWKVIVAPA